MGWNPIVELILTRGVNGPLHMNMEETGVLHWSPPRLPTKTGILSICSPSEASPISDYRACIDQSFTTCCTLCRSKALFTCNVSVCVNVTVNINYNIVFMMTQTQWVQTPSLCLRLRHYWHNAKFDTNTHANVDVDAKSERTVRYESPLAWETRPDNQNSSEELGLNKIKPFSGGHK